jgi:hypothetical protein
LKTRILPPRQVLAQVDEALAQKLSLRDVARQKPLEDVVAVLREGRRYLRASVELGQGGTEVAHGVGSAPSSKSLAAFPIKIASRTLGNLQVEGENAISPQDRVLLKQVAMRLARFLTSRGKVILRHQRESESRQRAQNPEDRGYQPASEKAASLRMAAGQGRRR